MSFIFGGNSMFSLLGASAIFSGDLGDYTYLEPIVNFLNEIIIPLTVVLAVAAAFMAIFIGVALAKADNPEKVHDMKRKLLGLVISVCVFIVFVWVLGWVLSNFGTIMGTIRGFFANMFSR